MCKKNITTPFKFFCYTDNPTDIIKDVTVVPYVDHKLDVIVHNKLFLFSKEFDDYLDKGPRMFFDLDLIIKHNIDHIVAMNRGELTVIRASWRKDHPEGKYCPECYGNIAGYSHHHMFNSSCMTWESPHTRCIWERFIADPEYYTLAFPLGMDSFMRYEHKNAGTNIHFFPERLFWSHNDGVDHYEREATWFKNPNASFYQYEKEYGREVGKMPIVLLNGENTMENYQQYKKYYED